MKARERNVTVQGWPAVYLGALILLGLLDVIERMIEIVT